MRLALNCCEEEPMKDTTAVFDLLPTALTVSTTQESYPVSCADLPVLTVLTALSLGMAVLHLEDGSNVTVGTEPNIFFLPSNSPFVLGVGDGEVYAVPDHLCATVRAALNLHRIGGLPLHLTLTGINQQSDAVTFQAVNQEGQAVALSVPHPVFTQLEFNPSSLAGPVGLIVTCDRAQPSRAFHFEIQPETPEGQTVLEVLGYADRFSLTSLTE